MSVQESTAPPRSPGGRWVPYDYANWYHLVRDGVGCVWCGRAGSTSRHRQGDTEIVMHAPAECLACGTVHCNTRSECSACFYGWMPGWSRGLHPDEASRRCGYTNCTNEAVAKAPRVGRVCKDDLSRPKVGGRPLSEVIEENRRRSLDHEGGSRWQWQWMVWREPAKPEASTEQHAKVSS